MANDITAHRTHFADTVAEKGHAGAEAAAHAADKLSLAARKAADQAMVARDKLCHAIEARPLTAVLIAFGVGAVLGRLMRR